MALEIANKRIENRSQEIRKFVKFLNNYYDIPHTVYLHVLNFPCTYDSDLEPAFGVFYVDKNDKIRIEIANEIEWYEKIHREKFGRKFSTYMCLSHIAHEFYHYLQYRDEKDLIENWVDYHASQILKYYASVYKSIIRESYVDKILNNRRSDNPSWIFATDPINFIRKKAQLKEKI